MKRVVLSASLVMALMATGLATAGADELTDLLDAAAEADYSGRQIVVTFIAGETALEIVEVEHAGSLMMVGANGSESLLGAGKLSASDREGIALSTWNASAISDRYTLGVTEPERRLDRAATSVSILEDGEVRMRLVFDDATGTPMVREVYDGAGKLFRMTSMLEINRVPAKLYASSGHQDSEYEVLVSAADHELPNAAAGYSLADAYSGPDDNIQGFYSDGLFSFSLFEIEGSAASDLFDEAVTIELDGRKYERLVNPGEMWLTWRSSGNTFVLVGDLPPDHLESVLAELPRPGAKNIFSRLWSGLFG